MPQLWPAPKEVQYSPDYWPLGPADLAASVAEQVDSTAAFAAHLQPDQRPEAYHLVVDAVGPRVTAVTAEGLLRARATLAQLVEDSPDGPRLPHCEIVDWPDFRFRCASDWLLNCEINRWAYDWGDGCEAYLARIRRKLDMCAAFKTNEVWFDGFGWDVQRTSQYAALMRECTRMARQRGIRLVFAGYGGGYGTSYQKSELYRCGYQGQVYFNRRPYPDGEVYLCCGCDVSRDESRQYGTCPSNEGLKAAKLAEMRRFVETVEPGCMYIHDVDTGSWEPARQSWLVRCDECRARWPSDEMADPQGQTGAFGEWFGQVSAALHAVRTDEYDAARDLALIFTSPLYTGCHEPDEIWEQEVEYFRVLSSLLKSHGPVRFGFREQFYRSDGRPRMAQLREALDEVGAGHGIHVISFGGGDNYTSNDLCNVSGALSHLFAGAQSVCLSNGGVHEEPVQALNAEFLWNGITRRHGLEPKSDAEAQQTWRRLSVGTERPAEIFAEEGLLRQACRRLWEEPVAGHMWRAITSSGDSGQGPVSRVWWVITREVRRLRGDPVERDVTSDELARRWQARVEHTREALNHARQAAALTDGEDVQWFARCLEVGLGFSEVLALVYGGQAAAEVRERLDALEAHLKGNFSFEPCDLLGGDPGCWLETLRNLRELA